MFKGYASTFFILAFCIASTAPTVFAAEPTPKATPEANRLTTTETMAALRNARAGLLLDANPALKSTLALETLLRTAELEKLQTESVSLQKSIEATFLFHKSLRVIQENREVLRADVRRAQAGWGPSVDIAANITGAQSSTSTTRRLDTASEINNSTGANITLTQPIWDGLATYNRVKSARASVASVESRVIDTGTSLALDALIAHIDVSRRREIFKLSVNNVNRHKESLEIARTRAELGLDTDADVSQADGRYSSALSALSETNATLLSAQDTYARLTGLSTESVLDPIAMPTDDYEDITATLAQALLTNPKWIAFKHDITIRRADRKVTQAAFSPQIDVSVTPSYTDNEGEWTSGLNFVASLTWNVFNSGADVANVGAASATVREATQLRNDFWDSLTLEVQIAWTEWKAAIEQQHYYEEAQIYNQQTLQAYQEQFSLGSRPILDVLDAESELYNTSVLAITSAGNAKINAYKLYALAGELLTKLEIDTRILTEDPR